MEHGPGSRHRVPVSGGPTTHDPAATDGCTLANRRECGMRREGHATGFGFVLASWTRAGHHGYA
jgi:hypothetical protein